MSQSTNWRTVSIALIAGIIVVSLVAVVLYYQVTISSSGTITTIKTVNCAVYTDGAGTTPLTHISWGDLPPGSAVNVTVWVKNTGNTPVNYTVTTSAWAPPNAQDYIGLTYDLKGVFNTTVGVIIPIVLTEFINASAPAPLSYSYNIVVTASG